MKVQRPGPDTPGGPRCERRCEVCDFAFWPRVVDVAAGKGKHCSNNCSAKAFRKPKTWACGGCGAAIVTRHGKRPRFCRPCRKEAWKSRRKSFVCQTCGDVYVREHQRRSRLFCCPEHARAFYKKTPEEKQATRKAYVERRRELYRAAVKRWREKVKQRDPVRWQGIVAKQKEIVRAWTKTAKGRVSTRIQKQRRRARLRDACSQGLSALEYEVVFSCAGGRCVYCGQPATSLDHVVPIARGGRDDAGNVVAACVRCNSSKCARLITEWEDAKRLMAAPAYELLVSHTLNYFKGQAA